MPVLKEIMIVDALAHEIMNRKPHDLPQSNGDGRNFPRLNLAARNLDGVALGCSIVADLRLPASPRPEDGMADRPKFAMFMPNCVKPWGHGPARPSQARQANGAQSETARTRNSPASKSNRLRPKPRGASKRSSSRPPQPSSSAAVMRNRRPRAFARSGAPIHGPNLTSWFDFSI